MDLDNRRHDAHGWVRRLRAFWDARTPPFDEARLWRKVAAQLPRQRSLRRWIPGWFARPIWAGASGFAAGVLTTAAVAFALVIAISPPPGADAEWTPLSGRTPWSTQREVQLLVAFRAHASVADMVTALQRAQATIRGGPTALGLWTVGVAPERAEHAVQILRATAAVESVSVLPR
ncbi:MAG: hypothetical protein RMK97_00460 [Sutterellaceae bacterium]|nr:hypothetical protein [Burkholderiaceae bacterium]MCX7901102.1 hypothetical protein [Burkholderiaceae bacterium]MDW8428974.1 hypothetical protein [Sutterellaceae bacterium]